MSQHIRTDRILSAILIVVIAVEVVDVVRRIGGWLVQTGIGGDFDAIMAATRRWVDGGPFYPAYQLAGPFEIGYADVLYPPTALVLFVPFTVLPAMLWWLIPLAILDLAIASYRPRLVGILAVAACLLHPKSVALVLAGNPAMWLAAALAFAPRYGWPAAFVVLKPSLAPLALVGVRRRSWWLVLGGLALASLLFLPMWPDYATVLANARNPLGVLYSLGDVPLLLAGIAAWAARRPSPKGLDAPSG